MSAAAVEIAAAAVVVVAGPAIDVIIILVLARAVAGIVIAVGRVRKESTLLPPLFVADAAVASSLL